MTLMNVFEHVAALSSDLELCHWSLMYRSRNRIILVTDLRQELTTISELLSRRLDDYVDLMKKVEAALLNLESISTPEERQLANSLLGELQATSCNNLIISDHPNKLSDLSFCDQVNLLKKVEATLISDSISDPEEEQLAASLVERYRAVVASPIPVSE